MRILRPLLFSFFLVLTSVFPAAAQDSTPSTSPSPDSPAASSPAPGSDVTKQAPATAAPSGSASSAPTSMNDVLDPGVQREHLFLAQMLHMPPLLDTYLQYLKADKDENTF